MTAHRATAAACSALLCGGLLLTATACGGSSSPTGPTSADAGGRMSQDARGLLADLQKLLKAPAPYTVSRDSAGDGTATGCGKGKERRSFAGRLRVPATPSVHTAMSLDSGSANGYLVQHGYTEDTHARQPQSDSRRSDVMVNKKAGTGITVVLTPAPGGGFLDYQVTGATDCLRAS